MTDSTNEQTHIKISDSSNKINTDTNENIKLEISETSDHEVKNTDLAHSRELPALWIHSFQKKQSPQFTETYNYFGPNTLIPLYFGGLKYIKNLIKGDIIIGDDHHTRIVHTIMRQNHTLYQIETEYQDKFLINQNGVLTLYNCIDGLFDIQIDQYLQKKHKWQKRQKLISRPIIYKLEPVANDPYMIGIILSAGNGIIPKLYNMTDIVREYVARRFNIVSIYLKKTKDKKVADKKFVNKNKVYNVLDVNADEIQYLLENKQIPECYLYNDKEIRFRLLMGFLDANRKIKTPVRSSSTKKYSTRVLTENNKKSILRRKSTNSSTPSTPTVILSEKHNLENIKNRQLESKKSSELINRPIRGRRKSLPKEASFVLNKICNQEVRSEDIHNITVINKVIGKQLSFVIKSLGFRCVYDHPIIMIYGDIHNLPDDQHINYINFSITCVEQKESIAMQIDGNDQFLLYNGLVMTTK